MRKGKASVWCILILASAVFSMGTSFAGDEGPPDFQVVQDWRKTNDGDPNCRDYFTVKEVRVLGKRPGGKTKVDVLVEIRGDWFELKGSRSPSGPCSGVKRSQGISQKIRKKLVYTKYDGKWHMESHHAAGGR